MHPSARSLLPLLLLFPVAGASANVDLFLCIQNIPGESTNSQYRDCIEVRSASDASFLEGPLAELRDLRFSKGVDRASIPLRRALITGQPLRASLHMLRSGGPGAPQPFWSMDLYDARVSSLALATDAGDLPAESFSLRPSRLQWTHRRARPDGSFDAPVFACWDLAAGTVNDGQCP